MAPSVELLLWSGCPSHERARLQLREVMEGLGLDPDSVVERAVETDEEAQELGFVGSPTVLVDGRDAVDSGDRPAALTCRLYRRRDGSASPLPDTQDLREALARATDEQGEKS
jgi:hypothetical protein